jgi:hypothetical protein
MKLLPKTITYTIFFVLLLNFTGCKTQNIKQEVPFTVTEKTYFNWAGGKKANQGITIKIVGTFETTNLYFSNIFFQNQKFEVNPEIRGNTFTLIGNISSLKQDMNMSGNSLDEYGNNPPKIEKDFPFDLKKDEAVIEYSISQQTYFFKVTGVKQLETVFYP